MIEFILGRANYWAIIGLMMVGLYITFQSTNLIKRLVGLSVFQTSVFLFYITLGKVSGGSAPIFFGKDAYGHSGQHERSPGGTDEAGVPGTIDTHDEDVVRPDFDAETAQLEASINDAGSQTSNHGNPIDAFSHSDFDQVSSDSPQLALTGLQEVYSNPLPHVLILTAIVVGVATLSVGLAIVVRIREAYGTIESDEVRDKDIAIADAQDADDPVVAGGE
ncbi:MAG: cation:proton antiporter subunit C [Pseudomonadota bacterium]